MSQRALASRAGLGLRARSLRSAKRRPRQRAPAARTWSRRLAAVAALAAVLIAGYMLWLRDSALVEVREVRVSGLSGPEQAEIAAALETAALEMTTLHVRLDELAAAVSEYPAVESLRVSTDFPHGLDVTVTERRPVALVSVAETQVAVSGDGILLPAVVTDELELPSLEASPGDPAQRLDQAGTEQAVVLGAAPEPLRSVTERATFSETDGVEVELEGGISLRFGESSRAAAKWAAAARILADPELEALTYIDLRSPARPAVGGAPVAPEAAELAPPG